MFEDVKTKTVKLFGYELLISERYAYDQLASIEFVERNRGKVDHKVFAYHSASTISDALKINLDKLSKFWFKYWILKRKIRAGYLVKKLTAKQLQGLTELVQELEGSETAGEEKKNKVSVLVD